MKKTSLALLLAFSSYTGTTSVWAGGYDNNKSWNSHKHKCSQFFSVWFPNHPRACPATFTWAELEPGLDVGTSQQAFDWRNNVVYSDIILQNMTGEALPENSKLLVTSSNLTLKNADGYNDDGTPFYLLESTLENGESFNIRANFKLRFQVLEYELAFEYGEVSDGTVAISGEATVTQTLHANVNDEDGVPSSVNYQWFADDVEISGANEASYTVMPDDSGKAITVSASYTDNGGFNESISSEAYGPVAPRPDNVDGEVSVSGTYLIGETLTASVSDANGVDSDSVSYQWQLNGMDLADETAETLVLTTDLTGQDIGVIVSYTDAYFYDESIVSDNGRPVTVIVNDRTELADAIDNGRAGDWIGLADGNYADMPELNIDNSVTLTFAHGSSAIISGATCLRMSANESALVGLTFDAIDMIAGSSCDSNGDSSVYVDADSVFIRENNFIGEVAEPSSSTYNWISMKDAYATVERNVFANKNTDRKGAAVSIYNNSSNADQYGHVIQYNLFKDFLGSNESSAYAIQVGRSTGTSANFEGAHVVRYNRFDNVQTKQRIIKVQSSRNYIYSNTFEDSIGNISLENGERNTVSNNIILPTGEDDASNDGGVSFTPYGHIISNNYIAGLRTTSSQRGGLITNSERFDDSGNLALDVSAVSVSNNTIINSRQPLNFSANDCVAGTFVVNFDSNLIANGEDPTVDITTDTGTDYGFEGRLTNGTGRDAIIDGCQLSADSSANNERYYSRDIDKNGTFSFPLGENNLSGSESEADIIAANFGLFEGAGNDTGFGADTRKLIYLTNEDVGPGSTYSAPSQPFSYDDEISFDLSTWNITFPDGTSENDPNWLLEGNTRADEFYYTDAGAMVFKSNNITSGTTTNSSFPRSEFREMLRGPEQDPQPLGWPSTQGVNKNNWVFSSSTQATQFFSAGVDGVMDACLRVDAVSTDGDSGQVGRVIIGQIHASDDEPAKLYYRKLPGNDLGSIYVNHEIPGVGDDTYNLIGHSSSSATNPADGVALGEVWCYQIKTVGQQLTVTVSREGKPNVQQVIMMDDAYIDDWMYFKAGVYNQNNTGTDSFAQATFFSLTKSHNAPPSEPGSGDGGSDDGGSDGGTDGGTEGDVAALQAAISGASEGDIIEASGIYTDASLVISTDNITITSAADAPAVFTGATCLYVTGSDVRLTGLEFYQIAQIDGSSCQSNGEASITLNGNRAIFDNNLLDSDDTFPAPDGQITHNWLSLKKSDALVERNTFQNKRGFTLDGTAQLRGGFITVFITGSGTNNTIQYNVFKDMLLSDQASAYAIQLGRSSSADATDDGFNTVQFNLFDNVDSKTRVIRVQGGSNVIHGNTIINSQGMIALEDGQNNEASNNVILPNGSDSNDGGISFAPYGHTVINNYIAGPRTSSSERGALYLNSNATGSGNSSLTPSPVLLSDNTVVNARQAFLLGGKSCGETSFLITADNNLIANAVSGVAALEGSTQTGRSAVRDDCTIDASSRFTNNSIYSDTESVNGTFLFSDYGLGNIVGADAGAELAEDVNGFANGTGVDIDKGADTSVLFIIDETDVGVRSSSTF